MDNAPSPSKVDMKTIAWVVYGFLAAGLLSRGMHFFGALPIIGIIIAAIKRPEAAGSIYESHFTWVIRTFIFGVVAVIVSVVLSMILPPIGMLGFAALGLWTLYRLVKGGLRLLDNKPVENPTAWV